LFIFTPSLSAPVGIGASVLSGGQEQQHWNAPLSRVARLIGTSQQTRMTLRSPP
jgi:hypothetical protein